VRSDEEMKVVFLAVDDELAGLMQAPVYEDHPEWVVGSVISTTALYKKNALEAALFVMRQSGLLYLAEMARMKIGRKFLEKGRKVYPTTLARRYSVEEYQTNDINSDTGLARLRSWAPDLLISTNFSQYVGKHAREIPTIGAWNLHKSFLPHYRGMAPSFYALLEGAPWTGATLHVLAKGFDTGDVLKQVKVPIQPGDTVYELNRRTADIGGRMLAEFIQNLNSGPIEAVPQPAGNWRNYSYPTRADIRRFRQRGLRF